MNGLGLDCVTFVCVEEGEEKKRLLPINIIRNASKSFQPKKLLEMLIDPEGKTSWYKH